MEAVYIIETFFPTHQTTQHHNPEDHSMDDLHMFRTVITNEALTTDSGQYKYFIRFYFFISRLFNEDVSNCISLIVG
jgi:hypothetical protein